MNRKHYSLTVQYGYRTLILLFALLFVALFFLAEYLLGGESNSLLLLPSIIFLPLTAILFAGFRLTNVTRIEKKYYSAETLVDQNGAVMRGARAGEKGSLTVSNEEWSFVSDYDTATGEIVKVTGIEEDGVTLRVTKISL